MQQTTADWNFAAREAQHLEALGFDSLWASDHMATPTQYTMAGEGDGAVAGQVPLLEAWTALAGIAGVTKRVELGTNCANFMFRHPSVAARQIATLDRISGGRAVPGLGAGYASSEFIAYGSPPWRQWQRVRALSEALDILVPLLAGEQVTYEGKYFQVRGAVCAPPPLRRPTPLLVGGASDTTLRATARYATIWNNPPLYEPYLEANLERLRGHCKELGRDADEITVSQRARVAIAGTHEEALAGLQEVRAIAGDQAADGIESHGIWGTPERVCEQIERYLRLGCSHFVIDFYGDRAEGQERFAREVMPKFR
jgi:probable F420-dependent oxidoreductase